MSLLARQGKCFVSHRINSFRLYLPLLYDLNIKPIIFSAIVRKPHRCFTHSLPPPVICISLAIIIAYWKRCGWLWALPLGLEKKQQEKQEEENFLLPSGDRTQDCVGDIQGVNRIAAARLSFLFGSHFCQRSGLQGWILAAVTDLMPFLLSHSAMHSNTNFLPKCCEENIGNGLPVYS